MQALLKLLQEPSPQYSTNLASLVRLVVVLIAAVSGFLVAHATTISADPQKVAIVVALATAVSHWAMEYLSGPPAKS